jgi:predicted amidophosphoribosyltransferase
MTLDREQQYITNSTKSRDESNYTKNRHTSEINICAYCLSLISTTALKCPHCGEWIDNSHTKEDVNICSSCEQPIPSAAIKCMHCGSWVNNKLEKDMGNLAEEEIKNEVDELMENLNHDL